eukprot:CAMPEP_0116894094 /NCGR_PEP_ID=MMETSP0467-20121206/3952_1 /TAXON_ID=283647 /ORGANISM="Mesodinium pulex, Strain SPMC105" /LENGTH=108 /DNA_ID=CAMNT_0004564149 /DNA_START=848 /DNA_END=1174 /DNA_ORIENTATION=+
MFSKRKNELALMIYKKHNNNNKDFSFLTSAAGISTAAEVRIDDSFKSSFNASVLFEVMKIKCKLNLDNKSGKNSVLNLLMEKNNLFNLGLNMNLLINKKFYKIGIDIL